MGFSLLSSVSVVLLVYVIQIQALLLPRNEVHVRRETQKFKLAITEKGTRFDERVEINEDEQIAYFNVPPHNGLPENEELFDYRMNVTVRRSKSDGACYLKPLPEDLPRPKDLDTGFTQALNRPTNYKISTVSKKWIIAGEVEKIFLRKEIAEFCDQYPVYRLKEYVPDSVSVARGRSKRDMDFVSCTQHVDMSCNPSNWLFRCKISTSTCVYYVTCRQADSQTKTICSEFEHRYSSIVCCDPFCP